MSEEWEDDEYSDTEFGKRRVKRRGYIMIKGRKRKLYRGKNGAYYYRTRSGKAYIKRKMRFGEMDFGNCGGDHEMYFGARSKMLTMLQNIADRLDPNFKYSSQVGRNGKRKLLTEAALKKKLTKSNINWKGEVQIMKRNTPGVAPRGGKKFKGGTKYLRMVANRWFGTQFKYSNKIDKKGRQKLLSEGALKKKLSAALKYLGRDWRAEANITREIVLEMYKQMKNLLITSGIRKTLAAKLTNKIMKDNEDGISMAPNYWYETYKEEVQRGKNPETAAWDTTGEILRITPPLADIAAMPPVPIGRGGRQSGYENFNPSRPGSMIERWQMDNDSGYLGQSSDVVVDATRAGRGGPAGIGYRAFMDDMVERGIRPGSEEGRGLEEAWSRAARGNSMNPPSAEAIEAMLAPDRPGPFGGGGEYRMFPERNAGVSLPVGGPGGGDLFDNDLSERLLGFGRKKRRTQYRRRRC